MSATNKIHIDPGTDLATALSRASREHSTVIVETDGAEYRLEVERVPKQEDETDVDLGEISRRAIRATAGSWKGVDTEALKAYIRERRLTPSRGGSRD